MDYEALRPYATERQSEYLDALAEHGSQRKAAKACGVNPRTLERAVSSLKKRAALHGLSPEHDATHPVPPGQTLRGISTLYDSDGNLVQQWVKSQRDREQAEAIMREVIEALRDDIPREKLGRVPKPKNPDPDLLNLYVLTDFHLGMLAWGEETGADWDTDIAEDLLVRWFERAIASSPGAEMGVLAELGDGLHWDGLKALTPESGHILDADTRYSKLVRVALRAFRRVVRMLLQKHDRVHIVAAEGNHDPASSVWLREVFAAFYEDEDRVSVDQSPDPYYCVEWGDTLLALHHGHLTKPKALPEVFASKFRQEFGRTKHCYGHTGHKHTAGLVENGLMTITQHRTLAAPDAYASRNGYMSGRSSSVLTYHKKYGEVGSLTITPELAWSHTA